MRGTQILETGLPLEVRPQKTAPNQTLDERREIDGMDFAHC